MKVELLTGRTLALARALMYLALVVLAYLTLRRLAAVLAPVGTGLFLAYVLNPWVARLERRGLPRGVAIALLLAGLAAFAVLVVLVVPPLVSREVRTFTARWADYQTRLDATVLPWLRLHFDLPASTTTGGAFRSALPALGSALAGASGDVAAWAATGVGAALQTATGILRVVVAVLLTPVFAIYFLRDFPALVVEVQALLPPRHRDHLVGIIREVNHALAAWLEGQLTVMFILGCLYSIGLGLSGIPLGVAIGILTGLLAFVPYVGVLVGLALAVTAALLDWHGAGPLLAVLATFGTVQLSDALFITPRVLGGRVGLSPVVVIFALFLGGDLLGYPGLLLAVPAAAVGKVLLARARTAYFRSTLYAAPPSTAVVSIETVSVETIPSPPDPTPQGDPPP